MFLYKIYLITAFFGLCYGNEPGLKNILNVNANNTKGMFGQFDKCYGYFTRIQWDIIDQNYEWQCDQVLGHTVQSNATGYVDNVRHNLNTNMSQIVEDFNGNEVYTSIGEILNGDCTGEQLVIETDLYVTKGKCKSGPGVTELQSGKHLASVTVSGNCRTTCFGTVWAHYWPGKH